MVAKHQESVGQVEDAVNTKLNTGCEQLVSFPKASVHKPTPDFAKPYWPATQAEPSTLSEKQVPSAKDIGFVNQVVIEPHIQTCPQSSLQAYYAAKQSSASFAVLPCTTPLPSSSNKNPPDTMHGRYINSAKTMPKLPLWLRPQSTELKEYEKRLAASSKPLESKCAHTGSVNSLSTLPCASLVGLPSRLAAPSEPQNSKCAHAGSVISLSTFPCAGVVALPSGVM